MVFASRPLGFYSGTPIVVPTIPVPSIVQQITYNADLNGGAGINGNDWELAFANPVQAGNALIIAAFFNGTPTGTASDSVNGTWAAGIVTAGANYTLGIWSKFNVAGGVTTLKMALSATSTAFQWQLFEVCNLTGLNANQPANANQVTGPTVAAGSFTPANNDANGGTWILQFAGLDGLSQANMTGNWGHGAGWTLLQQYGGLTLAISSTFAYSATQAILQTSHAAINPTLTCTGDSTDPFNTVAVAFNVGNSGSPRPGGMYINAITHFTFPGTSAAGSQTGYCPFSGNLRIVTELCEVNAVTGVTDSDGNTYTGAAANVASGAGIYYVQNHPAPSASTSVSLSFGASGNGAQFSLRVLDVSGAASSAYDTSVYDSFQNQSSHTFTNFPQITPGVSKGLTVATGGIGQGPGTSVTSPTNAVFGMVTYLNETDADTLDNADLFATLFFNNTNQQDWNWTTGSASSGGADCIAATFASA